MSSRHQINIFFFNCDYFSFQDMQSFFRLLVSVINHYHIFMGWTYFDTVLNNFCLQIGNNTKYFFLPYPRPCDQGLIVFIVYYFQIWNKKTNTTLKRSFFQVAVISILLYGCTTCTLTKRLEKKLDGNYTRMLWAILNKSWRQHPTRHQLYGHLPPITKTIQVRLTRHAGHCWRSRDELISDVLLWTPQMAGQKQNDQHEHTFSSYVRIWNVALKTCQKQWMIGKSDERGSGISVLVAQHDDDDYDDTGPMHIETPYIIQMYWPLI